ncbi:MAG: ribosomal 40S subunit protein S13 [Marteilia pararefringens]
MGRIYGKGSGKSRSVYGFHHTDQTLPSQHNTAKKIKEITLDLAKKGYSPAAICQTLRDQHGVLSFKAAMTGSKVLRLLRSEGLAPEMPSDLFSILRKLAFMKKHMSSNKNDINSKYHFINNFSKAARLARYYRRTQMLPPTFDIKLSIKEMQI